MMMPTDADPTAATGPGVAAATPVAPRPGPAPGRAALALAIGAGLLAGLADGPRPVGAGPPPAPARRGDPAALTRAAAGYRVVPTTGPVATLGREAAIRWSKPATEIEEAALYFWTAGGRPVAAGTFLRQKGVGLYHEFQSLATGPLIAEREGKPAWSPGRPGVRFAPVPGAPRPADSRSRRLAQMRAIAEDFRSEAVKGPPFYAEGSIYKFRLLARPLLTYEEPARPGLGGAVFGFVQDTDPEVLLLIEARDSGDGPRWEFALAPMTGWSARGWHRGLEVWSVARRHPGDDPAQPYFVAGPFPHE